MMRSSASPLGVKLKYKNMCTTLSQSSSDSKRMSLISLDARVRRLVCHPTEPSWLISAVQGHNEVSMWNMEIQCRQSMLWASSAQPFSSHSQDNNQKVFYL